MELIRQIQSSRMLQTALLVLLAFAVYQPVLTGGFIWDDDMYLTENPLIASPHGLKYFWFSTRAVDYYPLSSSLLWLEWRLWGDQAPPYHVVNVLLHAFNAVLLVAGLRRLSIPGAWLAGALFACHPAAVEAAAWIAQAKSLLAMLFCLASLLAWLRAEEENKPAWRFCALALFAASLLSKTSQVALPAVLLLLAWWRRGRLVSSDWLRTAPFFALAAAASAVTIWFQDSHAIGSFEVHPEGFAARLAGAGWVVLFYLARALVPVHLAAVYPRWQVDPGDPAHWLPLAAAVLLGLASWFIRIDGRRPLFVAYACFVLVLAPVLGFLDIGYMKFSLVADHWQYGALPAVLAPLAAGWVLLTEARQGRWRPLALPLLPVWLICLAALSFQRAGVFSSPRRLWEDNVAKQPEVVRGWSGLGSAYLLEGDLQQARTALDRALQLDPDHAEALMNRGVLLSRTGDPTGAIASLEHALRITPDDLTAHANLGLLYAAEGLHREAAAHYEAIARKSPQYANAGLRLAWLLATSADDAVRDPVRALALTEPLVRGATPPDFAQLDARAAALAASGRYEEAVSNSTLAVRQAAALGATNVLGQLRQREAAYRAFTPWRTPSRKAGP